MPSHLRILAEPSRGSCRRSTKPDFRISEEEAPAFEFWGTRPDFCFSHFSDALREVVFARISVPEHISSGRKAGSNESKAIFDPKSMKRNELHTSKGGIPFAYRITDVDVLEIFEIETGD